MHYLLDKKEHVEAREDSGSFVNILAIRIVIDVFTYSKSLCFVHVINYVNNFKRTSLRSIT